MNTFVKIRIRNTAAGLLGRTIAVMLAVGAAYAAPSWAATYTVLNNNNGGVDSLHAAINNANASVGVPDQIEFNIPGGGMHTILLTTDLPPITDPVDIEGYSQPGAVRANAGTPARLRIAIDAGMVSNGLVVTADDCSVRGLVVQNASGAAPDGVGIRVVGSRNHIGGNIVGIDRNGVGGPAFPLANEGDGVQIEGDDNVVGGLGPEDRNVISGNGLFNQTGADGVSIVGDRNAVRGNTIGSNTAGNDGQIGNNGAGVRLAGDHNHVGGTNPGAGNLITANGFAVFAETGTGNQIENNRMGTDFAGAVGLGQSRGVIIESSRTVVAGNVIASTATGPGVEVLGHNNTVQGNRVGTNAAVNLALPNFKGIRVVGSENTIGGRLAGQGNVVSGNHFTGIEIRPFDPAVPAVRNVVEGNMIGTNATGTGPIPNEGPGIEIADSDNNTIGARGIVGARNRIAYNLGAGINVESGARNTILGNSITENGDLGIDLADDGLTPNDVGDGDGGANGLQNYPEIASATAVVGGGTSIDWTLNSKPSSTYLLEFFANDLCDAPSGQGEGQFVLGTLVVVTDATGAAAGNVVTPGSASVGQVVVGTATVHVQSPVAPFPVELKATSEFSACRVVN
jgi:parallel beta-helix repeat protein